MRIVKEGAVREYGRKHADARTWLDGWLDVARTASWKSLVDVRRTYNTADEVLVGSGKPVVVFNVRGNNYRLIVAIHYGTGIIYVRDFMTHAEYDGQRWKQRH